MGGSVVMIFTSQYGNQKSEYGALIFALRGTLYINAIAESVSASDGYASQDQTATASLRVFPLARENRSS